VKGEAGRGRANKRAANKLHVTSLANSVVRRVNDVKGGDVSAARDCDSE
jgi:hypothetical protein